jgi:methionine sulfoxide reductase heme-binding subunit
VTVLAETQAFWYASRAAGVAAMVLATLSVAYGLMAAGRLLPQRFAASRVVHEALSIATLVAIAVHALVLLGDGFIGFSLADLLVPFVSDYARGWQALGIVAGWALVVLGLTYYARARIGVARWRTLHRFTGLAWVASLAHSLGEGTDAGRWWFVALLAAPLLSAAAALALRVRPRLAAAPARR